MVTLTKDILVIEDFLSNCFHSGLCPVLSLPCWVWHKFYSFSFFLCEMNFSTYFTGISVHTLSVLRQCWGKKGLHSLERTGGCLHTAGMYTVLTSLHVQDFTWEPTKVHRYLHSSANLFMYLPVISVLLLVKATAAQGSISDSWGNVLCYGNHRAARLPKELFPKTLHDSDITLAICVLQS